MDCVLVMSAVELLKEALTGKHWTLIEDPALRLLVAEGSWTEMMALFDHFEATEGKEWRHRYLDRVADELLALIESGRLRIASADAYKQKEAQARRYVADEFEWPTAALAMAVNRPIFTQVADRYDRGIPVWSVERLRTELQDLVVGLPPTLAPGQVVEVKDDVELRRRVGGPSKDNSPYENLMAGLLLHRRGDLEGARKAYENVIVSAHPDAEPRARRNLGLVLERMGELEAACDEYTRVIASGHPDEAVRASVNLGWLRDRMGDSDGARTKYEAAIASGHARYSHTARINLASLLMQQGDLEGAEGLLRTVIGSAPSDMVPRALRYLGLLLERLGKLDAARATYEQVVASADVKQSVKAQRSLDARRPRLGRLGKPEDATYAVLPQTPAEIAIARHRDGLADALAVRRLLWEAELYGIGWRLDAPEPESAELQEIGRQVDDLTTDAQPFELSVISTAPGSAPTSRQVLPLFTRNELALPFMARPGLLRNPGKRSLSVLKFKASAVLARLLSWHDTIIVINPGAQLEFWVEQTSK